MLDVAVTSRFGERLYDLCFGVDGGTIAALRGPSGAGKSTVLNIIAGLIRPDAGRIRFAGRDWFDPAGALEVRPERRRIGYVFQDHRLFPHLTVAGNLRYGAKGRADGDAFDEVVEVLGLGGLLSRRPRHLSGGERQRVAIGRALLSAPQLLLLDEPLASVDAARKSVILTYLQRLRDRTGIPMLYVSHAWDEICDVADVILDLEDGRIRTTATVPAAEVVPLRAARRRAAGASAQERGPREPSIAVPLAEPSGEAAGEAADWRASR